MDPRFGRAAAFVILDTASGATEVVSNAEGVAAAHGAGIAAAQLMAQRGVSCVITGRVGPKAEQALQAAGIRVVTGEWPTVREALGASVGAPASLK
jgi:predicted Fe-Mo cluster-binding NifX family protein